MQVQVVLMFDYISEATSDILGRFDNRCVHQQHFNCLQTQTYTHTR